MVLPGGHVKHMSMTCTCRSCPSAVWGHGEQPCSWLELLRCKPDLLWTSFGACQGRRLLLLLHVYKASNDLQQARDSGKFVRVAIQVGFSLSVCGAPVQPESSSKLSSLIAKTLRQ